LRSSFYFLSLKKGAMVYQERAGNRAIGTASPGKSSGNPTSSGNGIEIGIIISPTDKVEKIKLKTTSALCFNLMARNQFKKAAIMQKSILRLTILGTFSTRE